MGFVKEQREICAPLIELVEPLNQRMRENAVVLAKQNGVELDLDMVSTFTAVYGKDYDTFGKNGIVFYGRANNGWDEESEDFCMESICEQSQRPFFNIIKRVSEYFYEDWYNHIAWSNTYKLTPFCDYNSENPDDKNNWMFQNKSNTNPSWTLRSIQEQLCAEIVHAEQTFLNPLINILITGYNVDDSWDNPIWSNYSDYKKIGDDIVWCENKKRMAGLFFANDRFFIQTDRPECLPIEPHANAIIELIKRAKEYMDNLEMA